MTCGGQPLASGKECVCGGKGTMIEELRGLRLIALEIDNENVTCPFCRDDVFDLVGLASHLVHDCEPFNNIERLERV
jgi:hypothetical protein